MRQNLGQHFLKSDAIAKKIAAAIEGKDASFDAAPTGSANSRRAGGGQEVLDKETIIEIGPGHGELTDKLLAFSGKLLVIERDPTLAAHVRDRFGKNVEVIEGDALDVLPRLTYKLKANSYKLTGNIPYYLTGFLFRTIGELEHKPARTVFMIQKEVAERIVARPPRMNRLAAAVQYWAEPKLLFTVGRDEFSPAPDVDSAVIRLDTKPVIPAEAGIQRAARYYSMLHILFQQPRKTLLNNLAAGFPDVSKNALEAALLGAGIRAMARPQDLDLGHIVALSKAINP